MIALERTRLHPDETDSYGAVPALDNALNFTSSKHFVHTTNLPTFCRGVVASTERTSVTTFKQVHPVISRTPRRCAFYFQLSILWCLSPTPR